MTQWLPKSWAPEIPNEVKENKKQRPERSTWSTRTAAERTHPLDGLQIWLDSNSSSLHCLKIGCPQIQWLIIMFPMETHGNAIVRVMGIRYTSIYRFSASRPESISCVMPNGRFNLWYLPRFHQMFLRGVYYWDEMRTVWNLLSAGGKAGWR